MDLLTPDEDALDAQTAALRFDIELLAGRLLEATSRVENQQRMAPSDRLFRCEHRGGGSFGRSNTTAKPWLNYQARRSWLPPLRKSADAHS